MYHILLLQTKKGGSEMQVKEPIPEFIRDYQALIKENKELKKEKTALEVRLEMLEKGLLFLAQKLDETDLEVGLRANNEYLLKQLLQK